MEAHNNNLPTDIPSPTVPQHAFHGVTSQGRQGRISIFRNEDKM
jgi:hypothetical protein